MDTFKFELNGRRCTRFSHREVLDSLRRFAQLKGGPFTCHQWHNWPDRICNAPTILKYFGSWQRAHELIGLKPLKLHDIPAEDLIANLEDVWRQLGRAPGDMALRRRGRFSAGPYNSRWGSVKRTCERIAAHHRGELTRDELLRPDHPRVSLSLELRWRIMKRDRFKCTACGANPAADESVELHADHIVPVLQGGGNDESNLRTLCRGCNLGRRNEPVTPCPPPRPAPPIPRPEPPPTRPPVPAPTSPAPPPDRRTAPIATARTAAKATGSSPARASP